MVEAQSRAVEKFEISNLLADSAAMRAARCEIDLSPGNRKLPFINVALSSRIVAHVCHRTIEVWCAITIRSRQALKPPWGLPPVTN